MACLGLCFYVGVARGRDDFTRYLIRTSFAKLVRTVHRKCGAKLKSSTTVVAALPCRLDMYPMIVSNGWILFVSLPRVNHNVLQKSKAKKNINYPGKRPQTVSKEKKKTMKGRDTTGQS